MLTKLGLIAWMLAVSRIECQTVGMSCSTQDGRLYAGPTRNSFLICGSSNTFVQRSCPQGTYFGVRDQNCVTAETEGVGPEDSRVIRVPSAQQQYYYPQGQPQYPPQTPIDPNAYQYQLGQPIQPSEFAAQKIPIAPANTEEYWRKSWTERFTFQLADGCTEGGSCSLTDPTTLKFCPVAGDQSYYMQCAPSSDANGVWRKMRCAQNSYFYKYRCFSREELQQQYQINPVGSNPGPVHTPSPQLPQQPLQPQQIGQPQPQGISQQQYLQQQQQLQQYQMQLQQLQQQVQQQQQPQPGQPQVQIVQPQPQPVQVQPVQPQPVITQQPYPQPSYPPYGPAPGQPQVQSVLVDPSQQYGQPPYGQPLLPYQTAQQPAPASYNPYGQYPMPQITPVPQAAGPQPSYLGAPQQSQPTYPGAPQQPSYPASQFIPATGGANGAGGYQFTVYPGQSGPAQFSLKQDSRGRWSVLNAAERQPSARPVNAIAFDPVLNKYYFTGAQGGIQSSYDFPPTEHQSTKRFARAKRSARL